MRDYNEDGYERYRFLEPQIRETGWGSSPKETLY